MNEAFIIAGGESVREIDFSKIQGKDLIVVNKTVCDFPNAKYFVTMDYSMLAKLERQGKDISKIKSTKIFIANFVPPYMKETNGHIVDTRFNLIYDLSSFDMIIKSRKLEGFGYEWNDFRHGNNSGFCALQFAILMGYQKINLIGFDMCFHTVTHYHGGYNEGRDSFQKKLEKYRETFLEALNNDLKPEIKIWSNSSISKLNSVLKYRSIK